MGNQLSKLTVSIDTKELDEIIERLEYAKQLIKEIKDDIETLKSNSEIINNECFYTVQDVIELTGYSKPTVLGLFNMTDFPCCSLGRKKLVKKSAFWKFFDKKIVYKW